MRKNNLRREILTRKAYIQDLLPCRIRLKFCQHLVYITTSKNGNLKLHSYEINNNSDMWAIVIHGYYGKGQDMIYFAKEYYNRGYNVLVVDL